MFILVLSVVRFVHPHVGHRPSDLDDETEVTIHAICRREYKALSQLTQYGFPSFNALDVKHWSAGLPPCQASSRQLTSDANRRVVLVAEHAGKIAG